jgi:Protein of unknown function (DUF1573)
MDGVEIQESTCKTTHRPPRHWWSCFRSRALATCWALAAGGLLAGLTGWVLYHRIGAGVANWDRPIICREATWDFGTASHEIPQIITHRFTLENVSEEPVRVKKVISECGCVVADHHPSEIPPHSTAEFSVNVDPGPVPGPFQKHVHLVLETTPVTSVTLTIRGAIAPNPALYFAPGVIDFGTLTKNESRTRSVQVARYDGTSIGLLGTTSHSKALQFQGSVSGDPADSFIEVTVLLDSSLLHVGDFASSVVVVTQHPGYSQIEVPIRARIAPPLHGLIESIFVDRLPRGGSRDMPLTSSASPTPYVEAVHYEGEGAIILTLLAPENGRSTDRARPVVRIAHRGQPTERRLLRGELVANLTGQRIPVRIPLTVYLSD